MYINDFLCAANVSDGSMLDIALMTSVGLEQKRMHIANTCNNGHSTTKLFTAVAAGLLWDEGKLDLTERIADIFPELMTESHGARWEQITVADIMSPGVCGKALDDRIDLEGDEWVGDDDPLRIIFSVNLPESPDTDKYSDAGFYALSRVIELKSGLRMDNYLRKRLGMVLKFRDFAMACCPKGHTLGGGCSYFRAGDMAKLGYMLSCYGEYQGRCVLSAEYVDMMLKNSYGIKRIGNSSLFDKAGAYGQHIVFSSKKPAATAWHRTPCTDEAERVSSDSILHAFRMLEERI